MSVDSLTSRAALVTGAGGGVGQVLAGRLVASGWTVIVHASTADAAQNAVKRLVKAGAEPLRLETVSGDFAQLGEVARMAGEVAQRYPSLDLLVNAAHTGPAERRALTEDGHERTFQLNYLAPFMLTRLLARPLIRAHGRVVSVSPTLHRGASLSWADPTRTKGYTPLVAYGQAMLAVTMFTRALEELEANDFTAISVDPGSDDPEVVRTHRWATTPASRRGHHHPAQLTDARGAQRSLLRWPTARRDGGDCRRRAGARSTVASQRTAGRTRLSCLGCPLCPGSTSSGQHAGTTRDPRTPRSS